MPQSMYPPVPVPATPLIAPPPTARPPAPRLVCIQPTRRPTRNSASGSDGAACIANRRAAAALAHPCIAGGTAKRARVAARCALLCSTAWGTVSQSYREEILRESPLNALLKRFDNPFAFSNGVPGTAYTRPGLV